MTTLSCPEDRPEPMARSVKAVMKATHAFPVHLNLLFLSCNCYSLQAPSTKNPKFGSLNHKRGQVTAWRPKCFPLKPRRKLDIILATWLKGWFLQLFLQQHLDKHTNQEVIIGHFRHYFRASIVELAAQGLQEAEERRFRED